MTKALERMPNKRFTDDLYGYTATMSDEYKPCVLDLSFKRQRIHSPEPADVDPMLSQSSSVRSPVEESTCQESKPQQQQHQETNNNNNNNDKSHLNVYDVQATADHRTTSTTSPTSSEHYRRDGGASSCSSPEHESIKSPENRSYILTPPSEDHNSSSPKKIKLDELDAAAAAAAAELKRSHFQQLLANEPAAKMPTSSSNTCTSAHPYGGPSSVLQAQFPVVLPPGMPYYPSFYPLNPLNGTGSPIECPSSTSTLMLPSQASPTNSVGSSSSSGGHNGGAAPEDSGKKAPRPFKAYPKDPLALSLTSDLVYDPEVKQSYQNFRNRMLDSVKRTNEGVTNVKMRRGNNKSPSLQQQQQLQQLQQLQPTSSTGMMSGGILDEKDAAYWERRRKNNEAAKRSRDARRAKEDEIAIKAAFFEQEYMKLKCENSLLKDEVTRLKCMMYTH